MSKTDNTVLKDMIITMLLYGIIAQIVCLIIPGDHLRMTAGLWIGCSCSIYSRQLASDCECTYTVCRNYEFKACGIFAANYA